MKQFPILLFLSTIWSLGILQGQNSTMNEENEALPYQEIGAYPETYTAATVAARTIDALGFRYYWATEGLREEDLVYKPSEDARSLEETLSHIHSLCIAILQTSKNAPITIPVRKAPEGLDALRKATLEMIKEASDLLQANPDQNLAELKVIFKRGENESEFPFWNVINGQISDAIYHTGQVVSFRRSSGNPMNPKVNVFSGKTR